ncbi:F5D14.10 protein [Citrus sinensis]|uniref:F5D14.10 protein n=1 Tax=Citrus sinensis TaxID=2711 RepID=A0ACB8K2E9_CITSI|nr:F5D14.10 protein [Citrus sinensis]
MGSASNEEHFFKNKVSSFSVEAAALKISEEVKGDKSSDVVSILRELSLSVEEPELDAEQLRINDLLQEYEIHIHMEVPDEFTIVAKLNLRSDPNTINGSSDELAYSSKVQYLPPIVLTCLLPKSYPSNIPPYFTVSVQWLNSTRISNLCSMLESIWMDLPRREVIYQWTQWLQNSSLSYLGLDKEIVLGPYGIKYIGDRRAVPRSVSPDVDVLAIRSFNDERCRENFLKDTMNAAFVLIIMQTYSGIYVSEGTVNKLQCPDAKCRGMVPPNVLKGLLDEKEYERWEYLMLQKTLESMTDVAYCPRCQTPCIEDEDRHAQCSKCFCSFCTVCREKWHKRKEPQLIYEVLSLKEILRDAKQCPTCKMAISRIDGCNKMICINCGKPFCYGCNEAVEGYDHFSLDSCSSPGRGDLLKLIAHGRGDLLKLIPPGRSDLLKHIAHSRGDLLKLIAPGRGDLLKLIASGQGGLLKLIPHGRGDLLKLIPHGHQLKLIRGDLLNLIVPDRGGMLNHLLTFTWRRSWSLYLIPQTNGKCKLIPEVKLKTRLCPNCGQFNTKVSED